MHTPAIAFAMPRCFCRYYAAAMPMPLMRHAVTSRVAMLKALMLLLLLDTLFTMLLFSLFT